MTDHAQYKKKFAHLTPPLPCGEAGYLAEKIEAAVHRHKLDKKYTTHLQNVITSDIQSNGWKDSRRGSLDTYPELNAQYRLNAAALTIMDIKNMDHLSIVLNEIPMNGWEMDNMTMVNVSKPSVFQTIKNTFIANGFLSSPSESKEALNNLAGMRFIENHMKSCKQELNNL